MQMQPLTRNTETTIAVRPIHQSPPLVPRPAITSWPSTKPRDPAGPPSADAQPNQRATTVSSHPANTWARSLAQDTSSQDLINLSFAFSIYTTSVAGVVVIAWGTIVDCVWLAASGFLVTLAAWVLYGMARHDD